MRAGARAVSGPPGLTTDVRLAIVVWGIDGGHVLNASPLGPHLDPFLNIGHPLKSWFGLMLNAWFSAASSPQTCWLH